MQVVFLFYEKMTALDVVGPHEVLSRLPGAKVLRVAKQLGPISTCSGLFLTAEYSFSDVDHADILVVPGAGNATSLKHCPQSLQWIKDIHATTSWTTSVCTGSLILGAAGLLSGLRATTHWAVFDRLKTFGAKPTAERVVEDGKIMTAAGVSAGIDMALVLAEKVAGTSFAKAVQLGIEYDPAPPFDCGSVQKADPLLIEALRTRMQAAFEPC